MTKIEDRIYGAMFGVAVGDALGAPLEFMSAGSIRGKYGTVRDMIGGGWLGVRPGEFTDDTQMTLAVANGIVEAPKDPIPAIGRRFVSWFNGRPKDVGATCAGSIGRAISLAQDKDCPTSENWKEAAEATHISMGGRSGGNGALMRTAYVGAYYGDKRLAMQRATEIARMTHWDIDAAHDCAAYSAAIFRMVREADFDRCLQIIMEEICDAPHTKGRYPFEYASVAAPVPSGYGVDSLRAALHCFWTTSSFENAIVKAVNLGGDADTIGAITGGLAGAFYGYSAIPERWLNCLAPADRAEISAVCDKAVQASDNA